MTLTERIEDWLKRYRNPIEKEKHLLAEAKDLLEWTSTNKERDEDLR